MINLKIGILAEDQTDCKTIDVLIRRILQVDAKKDKNKEFQYSPSYRGDDGCGNLRKKARNWISDLVKAGCNVIILVHDLDSIDVEKEAELRRSLESFQVPRGIQYFVCIPIQEIEAWFLSDQELLNHMILAKEKVSKKKKNIKNISLYPSPQLVVDPKEILLKLSQRADRKARYSTTDNPKLAKILNLDVCAARCKSFRDLKLFLGAYLEKSKEENQELEQS